MADERTITCADCGAPYVTKRYNTKRCKICQVYRQLLYIGLERKFKCVECEQKFMKLSSGDLLCGKCDFITAAQYAEGECSFCHQDKYPLLHQDLTICLACARDPQQRELLIRALRHKRQARIAEHAVPA